MGRLSAIIILFTYIILSSLGAYAQNKNIDSLKAVLHVQKQDTETLKTLNKLVHSFLNIDRCDSAIYYSRLAVKMAEELSYNPAVAKTKFDLGLCLLCQRDYVKSYISFLESKDIFLDLKNELFVAKCMRNIAGIFLYQGNSTEALENFFSALNVSEKIKDTTESMYNLMEISQIFYTGKKYEKSLEYARKYEAYAYSRKELHPRDMITEQLGDIYLALKNDSLSVHYQKESLHLSELQKDTKGIGDSYNQLGNFYRGRRKFEESLSYFLKAEEMYRKAKYPSGVSATFYDRASVYVDMNKTDSALQSYFESKHLAELDKDTVLIAKNYSSTGQVYLKTKQYKEALRSFQQHLIYAKLLSDPLEIKDAYENLGQVYEKLNKPVEALSYFKAFIQLKDSIDKADHADNFVEIEAKRNFEKIVQENKIQQAKDKLEARIKIYSLLAGLIFLLLLALLLYRNNKHKQKAKIEIETAFENLKSTQSQLIQSEKMASLGELTAGIAHEIQNPLNFVNNFSEVNTELIEEMKTELKAGNNDEAIAIANDIADNEQKINHHGKRADSIVKGMLQHSRRSNGIKEPTDINALADEYLRLAYHGLRAKDKSFNTLLKTDFDESIGNINVIPQDIGRVILNLITNAFYAVDEKRKSGIANYEPTVSVSTKKLGDKVLISVKDNANGIPQKVLDKIFQPFFTTKPTGQGTGLGLSLSYDIVKAHGGELKVGTKEARPDEPVGRGEGTEFTILL